MGSFGDKFRKERERQGIKLEDVSNSTKIGSRMLRAIEEEHFDQLPGGVFNKGFIRAYAKHLGLDEEETITGYVAALNQFNSQQPGSERLAAQPPVPDRRTGQRADRRQAGDRSSDARSSNARSSQSRQSVPDPRASAPQDVELPDLQLPKAEHVRPRRRMAVHSDFGDLPWRLPALLALLIVAGAFWWSHSRSARANSASPAPASVSPPAATSSPAAGGSAGSNDGPATGAASSHTSSSNHTAIKTVSHSSSPTMSSTSTSAQSAENTRAANSVDSKESGLQPESNETPATTPAPRPVAKLTLVIRASENSWIAVTADGQPVVQETLIAPAHTSVRAAREIVVRAGNAAGVTFALNGQEFPSQGAEGEVKTLIFDSTGLHPAASPATEPAAPTPTDPAR